MRALGPWSGRGEGTVRSARVLKWAGKSHPGERNPDGGPPTPELGPYDGTTFSYIPPRCDRRKSTSGWAHRATASVMGCEIGVPAGWTPAMLELHPKRQIGCIRSWRVPVGRTNIVLDEDLVKQAMLVTGAKTKRQAVDRALRELVARGSVYRALRKLKGKMPWDGDVDAWRRARR